MAQGTGTSTERAPYRIADALTESDATVFPFTDALWVGGTGDVVVRMRDGQTVTYTAVPAGYLLEISCDQFLAASTATLVLALYYSKN
jgi:hypothetical protein